MARTARPKTARRKTAHRKTAHRKTGAKKTRKWSARVTERSHRRKASPFRSAMSMLNFYINRAGKNLSAARLKTLERAKDKLREAFDRPAKGAH